MTSLLTATDLAHWADTRVSQGQFPTLVRKLILASVERTALQLIDFPTEDSATRPGFDGFLSVTTPTPFVPEGHSAWELGTDGNPKKKANEDYAKRTSDPLEADPKRTAFVFVTPRRWRDKKKWEAEKRAERKWRDVRVWDADDLEIWLETCPAVAAWTCRTIRALPAGLRDVEELWHEWRFRTQPELAPDLFLAGRGREVERVRSWLDRPASCLRVRSESPDEAIGFFAALVERSSADERDRLRSRCVFVATPDTWRAVAGLQTPVVILAASLDLGAETLAVQRGHHVLLAYGNDAAGLGVDLELGPLRRSEVEVALVSMRIPPNRSRSLANESRGRLSVLADLIGGSRVPPNWANPSHAAELVPFFLVGGWMLPELQPPGDGRLQTAGGDFVALETLCGCGFETISRQIARWSNETDPPIRRVGRGWEWIARRRGWAHLARFVTRPHLEALERVVAAVVGESDPRVELPAGERFMASVLERMPQYSKEMKEGLASGLAFLASQSSHPVVAGVDLEAFVGRLVLALFGESPNPARWYSLSGVLPSLAEAAPDTVLDLIERDVIGNATVREHLFQQEGIFGGAGAYTQLLFALERMAWSPRYLSRVAVILSGLEGLSPRSNGNRPERSLRGIFLPWHPNTQASPSERLEAIDAVARRREGSAFGLCLQLMPRVPDFGETTTLPEWRDWAEGRGRGVDGAEYAAAVRGAFARLLRWVGTDPDRWSSLLNPLPRVEPELVERLLEALEGLDTLAWATDRAECVRHSIRHELHYIRTSRSPHTPLDEGQATRLENVYRRLRPADPIARNGWLFARNPELLTLTGNDWRAEQEAIRDARAVALMEVAAEAGAVAVLRLAELAEDPFHVGYHSGALEWPDDVAARMVRASLDSDSNPLRQAGAGIVMSYFGVRGWAWVETTFAGAGLSEDAAARFAAALPFGGATWDWLAKLGVEVRAEYWRTCPAMWVQDPADVSRAVESLLRHFRPGSALRLASSCLHGDSGTVLSSELLLHVLESLTCAATGEERLDEPLPPPGELGYEIGVLLDAVEDSGIAEEEKLLRVEWVWLPALEYGERGLASLHRHLKENPRFFASLIAISFRPLREDGSATEIPPSDSRAQERAFSAVRLLRAWNDFPGQIGDGTIDEVRLNVWVDAARDQCAATGHTTVGDCEIGEALSRAPVGLDGTWPHESLRRLVERLGSSDLDRGIWLGTVNQRGVTGRSLDAGGEPERMLSQQYENWAERLAARYPRCARILREVSRRYLSESRYEDDERDRLEYV